MCATPVEEKAALTAILPERSIPMSRYKETEVSLVRSWWENCALKQDIVAHTDGDTTDLSATFVLRELDASEPTVCLYLSMENHRAVTERVEYLRQLAHMIEMFANDIKNASSYIVEEPDHDMEEMTNV